VVRDCAPNDDKIENDGRKFLEQMENNGRELERKEDRKRQRRREQIISEKQRRKQVDKIDNERLMLRLRKEDTKHGKYWHALAA